MKSSSSSIVTSRPSHLLFFSSNRIYLSAALLFILFFFQKCDRSDPTPDIVFELRYCPDKITAANIKSRILNAFSNIPDNDLREFFKAVTIDDNFDGGCPNQIYRVGVWLFGGAPREKRIEALNNQNMLTADKQFAFKILNRILKSAIEYKWMALPKVYNNSGFADPNGKAKLLDYRVEYPQPLKSSIIVTGDYDGKGSFSITVNDELQLVQNADGIGTVKCITGSNVGFDTSPIDAFVALLVPFPFNWTAKENILSLLNLSGISVPVKVGIACAASDALPVSLPIPLRFKVVFDYKTLRFNKDELYADGSISIQPRTPDLVISSPPFVGPNLSLDVGYWDWRLEHKDVLFTAKAIDMRDPVITWNGGNLVDFNCNPALMQFRIPLGWKPGEKGLSAFTVKATDADGFSIEKSFNVLLNMRNCCDLDIFYKRFLECAPVVGSKREKCR